MVLIFIIIAIIASILEEFALINNMTAVPVLIVATLIVMVLVVSAPIPPLPNAIVSIHVAFRVVFVLGTFTIILIALVELYPNSLARILTEPTLSRAIILIICITIIIIVVLLPNTHPDTILMGFSAGCTFISFVLVIIACDIYICPYIGFS